MRRKSRSLIFYLSFAECDCFLPGSIGSECDDATGQCNCTEGARGLKCDSCGDFYFNLTDGCQRE